VVCGFHFTVTASSSESKQVGKTFLQLRLTLEGKDPVFLEMSIKQFYDFLSGMDTANLVLEMTGMK
jgi:hypothetical protein